MAEYRAKKLFYSSSSTGPDSTSYESVWAYSVTYPSAAHSTPGRFRIRVTKMTATDFIAMMGGDPSQAPDEGFSLQGYLEKWTSTGWLHCLDWMGSPDAISEEIEKDLCSMFQSFTTGLPVSISYVNRPPTPPSPPKKAKKKIPKNASQSNSFSVIEGGKPEDAPPTPSKDNSFDFV